MSPVRRTYVTINWIILIVFLLSLIVFIVARVSHNHKFTKLAGITCLVAFTLLWIAFAIEHQFLGV